MMNQLLLWCFLTSFISCSGLFYQPTKEVYTTPEKFKMSYETHFFPSFSPQKVILHAWHLKNSLTPAKPKSTLVYFHGNAQNLTAHFLFPAYLTQHGHDVFIFDYRGYGKSEGRPSQKGVYYDALAALDFAYQLHLKSGASRFIVYGHSLGGIIALNAVTDFPQKDKIGLLVAESAFSSYQDIAFEKIKRTIILWPFSPLAYLLFSDSFSAQKNIPALSPIPLLIIHGTDDEIIPPSFGKEIFSMAQNPKYFWEISQGQHGDLFHTHPEREKNRTKLLQFLEGKWPSEEVH